MRKRAIAQIVSCSIIAVILTGFLLGALGCSAAGLIDGSLPNKALQKVVDTFEKTVTDLPIPEINLVGIPVISDDDGSYNYGNGSYDETPTTIRIDWAAGRIVILATDEATGVTLSEFLGNVDPMTASAGEIAESRRMRHRLTDGTLSVDQFKANLTLHSGEPEATKTLLITLPKSALKTIDIDVASAQVYLTDLTADKLDLDTASGALNVTGCAFGQVDIDTASGSGTFNACSIGKLDVDSASAGMAFDLVNTPERIDVDSMSGSFSFALPADASFKVDLDSISGKVTVEGFENVSVEGNKTVVNGGQYLYDFDMVSGNVAIEAQTGNKF
ncbi:MAG: DUF4097 family beta strand repeat protein [Clostridia bacterium]|nr:DUF4097 family beta strand repeat protein [Clostridia bacterium]